MSSSDRPFAPTARRRELARKAGLISYSAWLTAAAALGGALLALQWSGPALWRQWQAQLAASADVAAGLDRRAAAGDWLTLVAHAVLPIVLAAALAALGAHLVQARRLWWRPRAVPGAPTLPSGGGRRALAGLAGGLLAVVMLALGAAWLTGNAATLFELGDATTPTLTGTLAGAALMALLTVGALLAASGLAQWLLHRDAIERASYMTAAERREELRQTRAARPPASRGDRSRDLREALAGARLVVLGEDRAVVIAWHPAWTPNPTIRAVARDVVLAGRLARHHHVPTVTAPGLARTLGRGPDVPAALWPQLADLVARGERT